MIDTRAVFPVIEGQRKRCHTMRSRPTRRLVSVPIGGTLQSVGHGRSILSPPPDEDSWSQVRIIVLTVEKPTDMVVFPARTTAVGFQILDEVGFF